MKKSVLFLSFIILTQANPLCAMYSKHHHNGHKPSGPRISILKAVPPLLTLAIILSLATPTDGQCWCGGGRGFLVSCCDAGSGSSSSSSSSGSIGSQAYAQAQDQAYAARNAADELQRRAMDYQRHIQDIGWQQGHR